MTNQNKSQSAVALILVDVINHFEYPDADRVLREALPIAPRIARLKKRAHEAGIPTIYVNDNFGQWRSDAKKLISYCLRPTAACTEFVQQLKPDEDDYFVLKPMHSAFYQTPLEVLLQYLGVTSLILCGLATNSCIICTAHDANMRRFELFVPSDCSASRSRREHEEAIENIREMAKGNVSRSASLRLGQLMKPAK
jgi:nicotinamidase-related amidase